MRLGRLLLLIACGSLLALMTSCREENKAVSECSDTILLDKSQWSSLYQEGTVCGEEVVSIRSIVGRDTLTRLFVLRDSTRKDVPLPKFLEESVQLQVPLKRVVVLSSAQIGYMLRLGLQDRIVAVGEGKYIADSALYSQVASSAIVEVGNGSTLDYEKLVALKPDLIMTFATGGSEDDYERMERLGLPAMLTSEWQENSPIAKAEWIKLYGKLFGVDAKTVFKQINEEYQGYSAGAKEEGNRPRVLAGMAFGGVWYAPGGHSYTAELVRRAGGRYLWEGDTTRELRLTLEEVIALSDSADVWINPGMFSTPDEITAVDPRVAHIKAMKDRRVYQNDGRLGPGGGNDFYESAVARPVELLENLNGAFYPAKNSDSASKSGAGSFRWYRNIYIF